MKGCKSRHPICVQNQSCLQVSWHVLLAPDAAGFPSLSCLRPTGGGDRHILVIDQADCMLYEAWNCQDPPTDLSGEQVAATVAAAAC